MGAEANNILAITAGVERGIHLNVQHLAVEVVDHIERSESFAAGQRITHEVHGPDGIRPPVLRRLAERVVAERLHLCLDLAGQGARLRAVDRGLESPTLNGHELRTRCAGRSCTPGNGTVS